MIASNVGRALVSLLLGVGTLNAQAGAAPRPAAAATLPGRVVEVAAGEFFFQAPDSIPAGLTTFRLRQIGLVHQRVIAGGAALDSLAAHPDDQTRGLHMLWLVRLDSGKTAGDLYRAAQARERTTGWARSLGGPGFALPPGTSNATLVLEPGNYVIICYVGSAREDRKRFHFLNGMFRALTVLPNPAPVAAMPALDVVIRVSETGALQYSAPIVAGRRVLRIENAGARSYEFSVRRVAPGRTTAEALAWRGTDSPRTPPPFEVLGGLSDVPSGGSLITTMDFEPGDYFVAAGRRPFTVLPARR
jgi:hypothetical protein